MLNLLTKLFTITPEAKLESLANQVAETSLTDAANQVNIDLSELSLAEARGYLRARCGQVVRRQVRLAIRRHPSATLDWATEIGNRAVEKLVSTLLRDLRVGIPRSTVLRRAA